MEIHHQHHHDPPRHKQKLWAHFALALLLLSASAATSFAQQFSTSVQQFISVNADTIALTHALVIDGTGTPAKPDQTIIIIKGKIAAIGNANKVIAPSTARIIDCTGKTIIPGMVMMHEHLFYGEFLSPHYFGLEMPVSFPALYLAGGVTTMRTTGSLEPQTDLNIRNEIRVGTMVGPEIDVTGPYIERAGLPIPEVLFIKSPDEAAQEVNYWADRGCTSFKLYMNLTRADAKAAIEAAHKRGLKVTGHLCSISFREAADLGIDDLEHGFYVSSDFEKDKTEDRCDQNARFSSILKLDEHSIEMKELMQYLIQKKVAITSTLPVFEPYTNREIFPGRADDAVADQVRKPVEALCAARVNKDSSDVMMFKKEMAWEKQFADMGGLLLAGVDPTGAGRVIPGYADRHVLEPLTEAGFTLEQAIKICSLNAATYLEREEEIGTVEKGKNADLVLIDGNLQQDIHAVRNTEIVFKNGIGFDSKKLFESMKGQVGLR